MQNIFKKATKAASRAWSRACAMSSRFAAWQRKGVETAPLSAESHECMNCHTVYAGNFCPRCGQSAAVARFTLRHALSKTLEVWGLGNRSLPRTLWHLVYRPGYMIGDYLEGRQAPYFPPVKMLFLVTTVYVLVQHFIAPGAVEQIYTDAMGQLNERKLEVDVGDGAYAGKRYVLQGMNVFIDNFNKATAFFQRNQAVELILCHSLFALLAMRVFRRSPLRPKMNLAECFFSQVFIASQLLMVSAVCIVATGGSMWMDNMYTMPTWLLLLVLLYDYKQLYGFGLLRTAWCTVKILIGWSVVISILLIVWMAASMVWTAIK